MYPDPFRPPGLIPLPFLPATARSGFIAAHHQSQPESFGTVRLQANEPISYYADQLIIEVDSDEMEPRLCKGDWLRCQRVPSADWPYLPAGVYAVLFADHFAIKRLKSNSLQHRRVLTFFSDSSPTNTRVEIPHEQLHQIWRILEIVSGSIF